MDLLFRKAMEADKSFVGIRSQHNIRVHFVSFLTGHGFVNQMIGHAGLSAVVPLIAGVLQLNAVGGII